MVVFFVKINENTYPKGRALLKIYRVDPERKEGITLSLGLLILAYIVHVVVGIVLQIRIGCTLDQN